MAGELGRAVLTLETDSTKFDKGIDSASTKATGLTSKFSGAGTAAKVLGGVMGGTLLGAMSDFANAAAEDEANTAKLQLAIENSGVSWDAYSGRIEAAIANGQSLAFSDDAVRNSLASLTESTGSADEALTRLPVAMDLARAKGISLEASSKLLGKVSDENTNALKKYGIVMQEGATATDVLAAVQRIAGGQAETYGATTAGSIAKVKDQIGEFTEGIGASMGPFTGYLALLPGLKDGMSLAGGAVGGLSTLIKGPFIASMLASIPATIAMMAPFLPVVLILGGIALAIFALKWAWENNLGDIQGKTQAVWRVLEYVFSAIVRTIESVIGFAGELFGTFSRVGSDVVEGLWQGIQNMQGWINGKIRGFINLIPEGVRKLLGISSPSQVFADIGHEIPAGLAEGISGNAGAATGAMQQLGMGLAATLTTSMASLVQQAQRSANNTLLSPFQGGTGAMSDIQKAAAADATNKLSGAIDPNRKMVAQYNGIPLYKKGTSFVPNDGLAYLHRGEAVIDSETNARGGRGDLNLYMDSRLFARILGFRTASDTRLKGGAA